MNEDKLNFKLNSSEYNIICVIISLSNSLYYYATKQNWIVKEKYVKRSANKLHKNKIAHRNIIRNSFQFAFNYIKYHSQREIVSSTENSILGFLNMHVLVKNIYFWIVQSKIIIRILHIDNDKFDNDKFTER